jgi:hypothetical protein
LKNVHLAQILNYLKSHKLAAGLLINFGSKRLKSKGLFYQIPVCMKCDQSSGEILKSAQSPSDQIHPAGAIQANSLSYTHVPLLSYDSTKIIIQWKIQ